VYRKIFSFRTNRPILCYYNILADKDAAMPSFFSPKVRLPVAIIFSKSSISTTCTAMSGSIVGDFTPEEAAFYKSEFDKTAGDGPYSIAVQTGIHHSYYFYFVFAHSATDIPASVYEKMLPNNNYITYLLKYHKRWLCAGYTMEKVAFKEETLVDLFAKKDQPASIDLNSAKIMAQKLHNEIRNQYPSEISWLCHEITKNNNGVNFSQS
jgi:hypothetical protein